MRHYNFFCINIRTVKRTTCGRDTWLTTKHVYSCKIVRKSMPNWGPHSTFVEVRPSDRFPLAECEELPEELPDCGTRNTFVISPSPYSGLLAGCWHPGRVTLKTPSARIGWHHEQSPNLTPTSLPRIGESCLDFSKVRNKHLCLKPLFGDLML